MQKGTIFNGMDLNAYLNQLQQNPKYTEEVLKLIEDDLRFGLTKEETEEYSSGKYDYGQMCVYSKCLRNGYSEEEKAVILKEGLSSEQMAVALEFYEKGVSLDTIAETISSANNTAYAMKHRFTQVLCQAKKAEPVEEQDLAYSKELMNLIHEVMEKISYQEKRYDALNEKLKEIGTAKQDEQIQNSLLAQLSEKDNVLEKQQNELNEAKVTIAKLHEEMQKIRKESKSMTEPDMSLNQEESENIQKMYNKTLPDNLMYQNKLKDKNSASQTSLYQKIEYRAALVDKTGKVVRFLPIEKTKKKDRQGIFRTFFSKLFYKKKPDFVKLLSEKDLSPEQLVQIRNAMEKGLSENQLIVLINSKMPAEQMAEIIDIAVYENKMKEVRAWD